MGRRALHRLAAASLKRNKVGLFADGGGLYLQVTKAADGRNVNRSWLFRFKTGPNKDRWMGLGPAHTISLSEAREAALQCRKLRLAGEDPIARRDAARAAAAAASAKQISFAQCAHAYISAKRSEWRNQKHAAEWPASLRKHVFPTLGTLSVTMIDTALVLRALRPVWESAPETASRLRGRIEAILDWATVSGLRQGDNPARWSGHLEHLLSNPNRRQVRHHAAMPVPEIPAFMTALRQREGIAARALEFCILTAARSGEVFGMAWSEADTQAALWIVPASRTKAARAHRVPLAPRCLKILDEMRAHARGPLVFPGRDGLKPLAPATFSRLLEGLGCTATVHGFRSTFRDWAAERTNFPREAAEMALAHAIASAVEAAYRRGDLLAKRQQLMAAWARYCSTPPGAGEVVPLRGRQP